MNSVKFQNKNQYTNISGTAKTNNEQSEKDIKETFYPYLKRIKKNKIYKNKFNKRYNVYTTENYKTLLKYKQGRPE